jgi:DNA polymerase-2
MTLKPIIERRLALKDRARSLPDGPERAILQHRQKALKWLLVTCFGYLGYKNARFGRIEAHESTTAYGREMLLRAKEIAELHGYRFLHALTDSLWVQKSGATMAEHRRLAAEIGQVAGLRIEIEGVYRWLVFLPSRQNAQLSVANRYYGLFETGELKVRGIEMRRHDTIAFVRDAQQEMLTLLSSAQSAAEYTELIGDVLALARAQLARLRRGDVDPGALIISANLSHAPSEYRANLPISIAARELEARGIQLSPGERIDYVLTTGGGARPFDMWSAADRYDGGRYEELYIRMLETLCAPAGIGRIRIREHLAEAFQLRLPGIPAKYFPS